MSPLSRGNYISRVVYFCRELIEEDVLLDIGVKKFYLKMSQGYPERRRQLENKKRRQGKKVIAVKWEGPLNRRKLKYRNKPTTPLKILYKSEVDYKGGSNIFT